MKQLVLMTVLATACKQGSEQVAQSADSVTQASDSLVVTDVLPVIENSEGVEAVHSFFSDDTTVVSIEVHTGNLLMTGDADTVHLLKDAIVAFISRKNGVEGNMYPTFCPGIVVFTFLNQQLTQRASSSLPCYTNYDDSFTELSFNVWAFNDSTDVIIMDAESKGWSGDYSSSSKVFSLFVIDRGQVTLANEFGVDKSEESEESTTGGSGDVGLSPESTGKVPDLLYTFTPSGGKGNEESVPVKKRYVWNGTRFELAEQN